MKSKEYALRKAALITGASLLYALAGCGQDSTSLAFLKRIEEPVAQQISETKDKVKLVAQAIEYSGFKEISLDFSVPEKIKQSVSQEFPQATIQTVKRRELGYPEPNLEYATSFAHYAQELIEWTQNHPVMKGLPQPSLEFIVTGKDERKTTNIPCRIDLFRMDNYRFQAETKDRKINIGAVDFDVGGSVNGISTYTVTDNEVTLAQGPFSVALSTGNNTDNGLLMVPLSEYLPLVLQSGVMTHFAAYQQYHGGKIPPEHARHVIDQILKGIEAVTEAGAAHFTLAYIKEKRKEIPFPKGVEERIRTYVTKEMEKLDPRYEFVPDAFQWMEDEGISKVFSSYLTHNQHYLTKLQNYNKKRNRK